MGCLSYGRTRQGRIESPSLIPTTPPKRGANYSSPFRSAQHATGNLLPHVIPEPNGPKRLRTRPLVLELFDPQDRQDNPPGREELTPEASRKKSSAVPTTNVGCTQASRTGRAAPTPPLRMMSEDEHIRPPILGVRWAGAGVPNKITEWGAYLMAGPDKAALSHPV